MVKELKNDVGLRPYKAPKTVLHNFEMRSRLLSESNPDYMGSDTETGKLEFDYD